MVKIAALAVCETVLYVLLKYYKPEFAPLCEMSAVIALFFILLPELEGLKDIIIEMTEASGISSEYLSVMIKAVGLSLITGISADMCRDSGQAALGTKIEFFGAVSVLTVSLPLFKAVLQLIASMVKSS